MAYPNIVNWHPTSSEALGSSILAIGDSWFSYLPPGGSLVTRLGDLVDKKGHKILVLGNNGAEAYDYIKGKYRKDVTTVLRQHGKSVLSIFLSCGGNDFSGFSKLRPLLRDDCSKAETVKECFRPGNDYGTVKWLFDKTLSNYENLIEKILDYSYSKATILLHNYDYAILNGKGFAGGLSGPWLLPALEDARVPEELRQACVNHLIDEMTALLKKCCKRDADRIILVDSRNTLEETHWANELHPKPSGFKKLANECWKPVLTGLGLA